MFLTFLFRSAPEEGLYCKPKYRAKKFVFLKNKYISVILAFVVCSLKLVTSAVGISLPLIFCILSLVWPFSGAAVLREFRRRHLIVHIKWAEAIYLAKGLATW